VETEPEDSTPLRLKPSTEYDHYASV